jgi:2-amino-4-hydroxy-6-hydroxymethyldihydropteridine diphosphokinase
MSLIIATGSNIGERVANLKQAQALLSKKFTLIKASRIYESPAIEYTNQPDFLNQVLEFELPDADPSETMRQLLDIEKEMGRNREIPKGPRNIDIDILFWGKQELTTENLIVPHPRWQDRSFVVFPLMELPFYDLLKRWFNIPTKFSNDAYPYEKE